MMNFRDYTREILQFFRDNGIQVDPEPKIKADLSDNGILDPLIRTGNYNPTTNTITIFVKNRQLKDILRSFCHELIHHNQYLSDQDGFFDINKDGKLQENEELEKLEADAYSRGNIMFRKWTESKK